jgi:hypothetical protein
MRMKIIVGSLTSRLRLQDRESGEVPQVQDAHKTSGSDQ